MDISCCLCKAHLPRTDKRNRRKLHGDSCRRTRDVLESNSRVPLQNLMETSDPNAYLCNHCVRDLNNILSYQSKIDALKSSVMEKLSVLQVVPGTMAQLHPASKRPRLDSIASSSTAVQLETATLETSSHSTPSQLHTVTQPSTALQSQGASQFQSPDVQVSVQYKDQAKMFHVHTPVRKQFIKKIARRSYKSLASTVVNAPATSEAVLRQISRNIKDEMKQLSTNTHDSVLRDTVEAIKFFHWDTVFLELEKMVPTLISLLQRLIPRPSEKKPLIAMLASQLLKTRHQRLGLVQRAVSVMLYGNCCHKQVFVNLQPLNICMSYTSTLNTIENISQDHDIEVQCWADELKQTIAQEPSPITSARTTSTPTWVGDPSHEDDESEEEIVAPPYSPISVVDGLDEEISDVSGDDLLSDDGTDNGGVEQEVIAQKSPSAPGKEETEWFGFKLVGDNIDKTIRPRFQRHDHQTQSLHHFASYAALDRVNMSTLSDKSPEPCQPDAGELVLSSSDLESIAYDFTILMSRIIVQHMTQFSEQRKVVPQHIPSKYSEEMSRRTVVIPMGVLLLNENKLDEMSKILEHFMAVAPSVAAEGHITLPNGSKLDFDDTRFHRILLGGDQLTVARIRGAQSIRASHDHPVERLEGVVPVIEDWHSRMALMKVIWQRFYSPKSANEKGTMYQLRNLINRTAVPPDPKTNMNAAEDFLVLLLHSYVVAAAKHMHSLIPASSVVELTKLIIVNFVRLPQSNHDECQDTVHVYASDLLTLALVWHGFHDAIKEGDGDRILRYWKLLLIIFQSTNHPNYAKEAVNLLLQNHYFLSERQRTQLLWSRCINTRGQRGANIPCDLHMEHIIRRLKRVLRGLGSNITPKAIVKAGKSIAAVHRVSQIFEQQTNCKSPSHKHSFPSFKKELTTIVNLLEAEGVFTPQDRQYATFKSKKGLLHKLTQDELLKKVQSSINKIYFV